MSQTILEEMSAAPTDLASDAVVDRSKVLRHLLADTFVLHVKTKNFHWHMSGPHFRDYHMLLDDQAEQIFAMTELRSDNQVLTRFLRSAHKTCDDRNDVATASLIENWIDQAERRTWFLSETVG